VDKSLSLGIFVISIPEFLICIFIVIIFLLDVIHMIWCYVVLLILACLVLASFLVLMLFLLLDDPLRYRAKGKVKSEFKLYVLAYFNIKIARKLTVLVSQFTM
jgi:archaellum biogenesis protein FlaJ (TadC family)